MNSGAPRQCQPLSGQVGGLGGQLQPLSPPGRDQPVHTPPPTKAAFWEAALAAPAGARPVPARVAPGASTPGTVRCPFPCPPQHVPGAGCWAGGSRGAGDGLSSPKAWLCRFWGAEHHNIPLHPAQGAGMGKRDVSWAWGSEPPPLCPCGQIQRLEGLSLLWLVPGVDGAGQRPQTSVSSPTPGTDPVLALPGQLTCQGPV